MRLRQSLRSNKGRLRLKTTLLDSGATEFMIKHALFIASILCICPFAANAGGDLSFLGDHAAKGLFLDESYDVRDAQDRPIADGAEQSRLKDLFRQTLIELTVISHPALERKSDDGLKLISALFLKLLLTSISRIIGIREEPAHLGTDRFVHSVNNLWITLIVGIFWLITGRLRIRIHPSLRDLPLRC